MDQEDLSTTIVFSEGGGSFYYQVNVNLLRCFCSTLGSNLLKNCSTDWQKNIFGSEKCLGKQLMFLLRVSDKNLKKKKSRAHSTYACSVTSDCLRPHGRQPVRLLCPWDSPDKNTGVCCHALLQGIFLTQGWNPRLLHLLHWQVSSLPLHHQGSKNLKEEYNFWTYNLLSW